MRRVWALALLFVTLVASGAEVDRALEHRVKAAYLYRFTEFVAWPDGAFAGPDAPIVIGIAGADGVTAELAQIAGGRNAAGRRIELKRVAEAEGPLHILFVPASERARIAQLARTAPRHTLIVTESEGALAQGSVINFVIADGRVRFEISVDAAEKRGIRVSARMLAVAQVVKGGP